jgi:hypothetical protein
MKRFVRTRAGALLVGSAAFAAACGSDSPIDPTPPQPGNSVITGNITQNRTLSADTVYQLRGIVQVQNGATLTIQPGTRITGSPISDAANRVSALIVMRGARLVAEGTRDRPIVFTSAATGGDADPRYPGDWGGLVIVGNATTNRQGRVTVEGPSPADTVSWNGGTDDNDSRLAALRARGVRRRRGGTELGAELLHLLRRRARYAAGVPPGADGARRPLRVVRRHRGRPLPRLLRSGRRPLRRGRGVSRPQQVPDRPAVVQDRPAPGRHRRGFGRAERLRGRRLRRHRRHLPAGVRQHPVQHAGLRQLHHRWAPVRTCSTRPAAAGCGAADRTVSSAPTSDAAPAASGSTASSPAGRNARISIFDRRPTRGWKQDSIFVGEHPLRREPRQLRRRRRHEPGPLRPGRPLRHR